EALLDMPRIWSNLSVAIPRHIVKSVPVLKRRIELAKGTPLNVTLSAQCEGRKLGVVKNLHSLVFATGTHRWRSLTILCGQHDELKDWIPSIFHGEFSSLEELDIQYTYTPEDDIYEPIYLSIESTANRLLSVSLVESQILPEFLERKRDFYSGLVTFKAGLHLALGLRSHNLLNLELRGDQLIGDVSKLKFPPTLSLPSLSLDLFQQCKFDNVTHLAVHRLEAEGSWAIWTVNLPSLLSLTCRIAKLSALPSIQAPHLKYFSMGIWTPSLDHWRRPDNQEDRDITRVFQARTFSIQIRPTTLRLESPIPLQSLCVILQRWPQIEHLSFHGGYDCTSLKELE
ncbi:16310_t:CDS:1, partial [Acaulospora colombiana]